MRKPNVSEATNEFIGLAIQCEHSDQPTFAGHCYVGAAKCEASAGNFLGEAEHYLTAARQFMKAEKKLWALRTYSPERENLEAAIGCFIQALNRYPEKSLLRTSILLELSNDLVHLNKKSEAACYFEQALETVVDNTMRIMCLRNLLNLQIDCEKYVIALETANKLCDGKFNLPEDLLAEVQVSRILLTLLAKPTDENKPASLNQLFNDLMNDNDSDTIPFNTDLRLKLQSIVVSHGLGDAESLVSVTSDTKHLLTSQQVEMLQKIITEQRLEQLSLK
ncbi:uncharacterized protein LOC115452167 isoform X2 [Manduca sexta]|nr:uncharacterized protein LOC115452167 isoform X2 [Manduca sexta]KAG6463123.1 hypothetical protein O3G_MSEX013681 [Manduca sexta]